MRHYHLAVSRHFAGFCAALGLLVAPCPAYAQVIVEQQDLSFGQLVIPPSGAVVEIDTTGTITMGSTWVMPASGQDNGAYQITDVPGNVDITITNISTCEAGVTISHFAALFMGVPYADISTTGISGVAFDGDEVLELGARLSYGGSTSLGACAISFDLNVIFI